MPTMAFLARFARKSFAFAVWHVCTSFARRPSINLSAIARCIGMGGNGSGAKKGRKRRTNAQIDADNRRERREAADERAANVAFWNSYAAGQPAAQPAAATIDVDDNHDDDAAAADAADDANDAVPNPADPQPDPPLPAPPADPPGPPIPLYEVGDSIIYFGDDANMQGTICAVDGGIDTGDLPMYKCKLAGLKKSGS